MEMKDGCSSDPPFHPAFQLFCYPIFLHKKSKGIDELIHKIGRENVLFAQQPNNYRIPHKPFLRRNGGRSGFSRIPVYEENLDDIKGVLYVKDLLPHLGEGDEFGWQQLLRPAYFVPEHKKINDLLEDFQKRKIHIAVVVDEYGGTLGVVSLEDILEEIVGEIADESDIEAATYERIDDHRYWFEGRTHLGDFLRVLELPDTFLDSVRGDADTLAGLMLEIRGEFFGEGDEAAFEHLKFKALRVENRRITKVEVMLLDPEDPDISSSDDGGN